MENPTEEFKVHKEKSTSDPAHLGSREHPRDKDNQAEAT